MVVRAAGNTLKKKAKAALPLRQAAIFGFGLQPAAQQARRESGGRLRGLLLFLRLPSLRCVSDARVLRVE